MQKTAAQAAYYKFAERRKNWTDMYEEAGWHVPKFTRKYEAFQSSPYAQGIGAAIAGGALTGLTLPRNASLRYKILGTLAGAGISGALGAGSAHLNRALGNYFQGKNLRTLDPDEEREKGWRGWKRKEDLPEGQDNWWS